MAHGSTYTFRMGANVVRDAAGNQNADTGTTQHPITNNVGGDSVRPTFVSAETSADGSTFSITFSEPIQQSVNDDLILVYENGSLSTSLSSFSSLTVTDKTVEFEPSGAMAHGSTYTFRMGANVVRDAAGNQNADTGTTQHPITNNVQMAPAPTVTTPGAPTGLTATADGQTAIDLRWTAPTETGGAAISGYRIEFSTDGGANWGNAESDTGSTDTTYEHAGLTAGTTRHYRVSAINSAGAGTPSATASATTDATTGATPNAPPGFTSDAAFSVQENELLVGAGGSQRPRRRGYGGDLRRHRRRGHGPVRHRRGHGHPVLLLRS